MNVPRRSRPAARLLAAVTATVFWLAFGATSPANAAPKDVDSAESTSTSQTSTQLSADTASTTTTAREKNREKN